MFQSFASVLVGLALFFGPPSRGADDLTVTPGLINDKNESPQESKASTVLFTFGTGLALYNGDFSRRYQAGSLGWQLGAGFLKQLGQTHLYWGGDFALAFWGFPDPTPGTLGSSRSATSIQALPTLVYRFGKIENTLFQPYFGFSLGPNLYVLRTSVGGTVTGSDTATALYLEMLARPGVDWAFSDAFAINFEMKVGLLNWDLILLPQLNLSIAF